MNEILAAILTSAGVTGLAQGVFKFFNDAALAKYKRQLEHQSELEIVRLKSDFEVAAAENHVRYTLVFEKTAEVLADTYKQLVELNDAASNYANSIEKPRDERKSLFNTFKIKADAFMKYFYPNRIYLEDEPATAVEKFFRQLYAATVQYSLALANSEDPNRAEESYGHVFETYFATSGRVPELLRELEKAFQKNLGVRKK